MFCPFCEPKGTIISNNLAYAIFDKYPVNPGHMLIIPKRHIPDIFACTPEERSAIYELIEECRALLEDKNHPDGFNIGINCGAASGQTIFHLHIHLIPRYEGDIANPTGGVRGVIPEKRIY